MKKSIKRFSVFFWLLLSSIIILGYQNCAKEKINFGVADSNKASPIDCEFGDSFVRNGESVDAFALSSVPVGQVCYSEKRTCNKGQLTGKFLFSRCEVGVPKSCTLGNKIINHGGSISAYSSDTVAFGSSCSQVMQVRSCNDGLLNGGGQYTFTSCNVAPETVKLPCTQDGLTLTSGQSNLFFQARSVPYGQECLSQARTCSNGTLSGSYQFSSCSKGATQTDQFDFIMQSTSMPVDLIIVLDNSGSMSEEAAHVQKNLTALINSVSNRSDIRVGVISSKHTTFGIDVSKITGATLLGNRLQQADQEVGSWGALACLLKNIEGNDSQMATRFPKMSSAISSYASLQNDFFCTKAGTKFSSVFLRLNSHKVVVVISDDESTFDWIPRFEKTLMNTNDFYSILNTSYFNTPYHSGSDNMTFFGFIGLGSISPCQSSRGVFYEKLAAETNGRVFDICDADWTQHFNSITNASMLINSSSMQLKYSASSILEVKIDGNSISTSDYQVFGRFIKLDTNKLGLVNGRSYKVSVQYTYN
jgi:hypothetical protein